MRYVGLMLLVGVSALSAAGTPAAAQQPVEALRTRDGHVLDLPADGAWRVRARGVADLRAALRSRGDFGALNAALVAAPGPAPAALTGTMYVPALMIGFADTDTTAVPRAASYDSLYFSLTPPAGRSYSLRTLYREMSNDLLDVRGTALGWVLGDSVANFYLETCGAANAYECTTGRSRLWGLVTGALADVDPGTDFGQFDNDGPDGVPNSGDDDGFVDVLQLVQPVVGGECGGRGIWAHRWFLSALGGGAFATDDAAAGGGTIRINSYYIVSGVGGAGPGNRNGCGAPALISGIGTAAHEFGHAIALPDLYDTGGGTNGIGEWGLMGSGGYTSANSPTHIEAWSKERLGWVTVVPVTANATVIVGPVVTSDTVLLVRPPAGVANPRGEYFLVENRQPVGSDTSNMITGGAAGAKGGGLAIWHVDSAKVRQGSSSNTVNYGVIHGVALEQADGLDHLGLVTGGNRGDAGDPYPGMSVNHMFSYRSLPPALKNADGAFAGVVIDSIQQVVAGGAVAFRVRLGIPLVLNASGPGAIVSTPSVPIDTLLVMGEVVTLVAAPAAGALFDGWSGDTVTGNDTLILAMTRPWSVKASFATALTVSPPAPATAVMGASFSLELTAAGGDGQHTWSLEGGQLPPGVTLRSTGSVAGVPEATGTYAAALRVVSGSQSLDVPVEITVTAPALAAPAVLGALVGTSTGLTSDERRYLDLLGNRNGRFDLGDFHAFIDKTGGSVTAAQMAELLRAQGGAR